MILKTTLRILKILNGLFLMGLMLACASEAPVPTESSQPTLTLMDTPTEPANTAIPTPLTPTATLVPSAARVNGKVISLEFYRTELARFQGTSGTGLATYGEEKVLEDLIDQVLLAQAATEAGFDLDDETLQTRIQQLGLNDQELQDWQTTYGYTQETFLQAMRWSVAAAWMRDQIIAAVPETAEQVHARQILLYNSDEADRVLNQLETGTDFETLAAEYDPLASGDLGWFPRGYLTVPEMDDVIFALEPDEYSPIIPTALGYHIVQLIEHQMDHRLSPDAYRVAQVQALQAWLVERRNHSEISISLP